MEIITLSYDSTEENKWNQEYVGKVDVNVTGKLLFRLQWLEWLGEVIRILPDVPVCTRPRVDETWEWEPVSRSVHSEESQCGLKRSEGWRCRKNMFDHTWRINGETRWNSQYNDPCDKDREIMKVPWYKKTKSFV